MRIFYEKNNNIYFYDLELNPFSSKTVTKKILSIDEIDYKLKDNDILVTNKPNLISQYHTNAKTIFNRLGYDLKYFKHYRIENKETLYYDKLLETISENEKDSVPYINPELQMDKEILEKHNLFFDDKEFVYYKDLFNNLQRNPTYIELYDLVQSNSEHARHWFFRGQYDFSGMIKRQSLMKMVKRTLNHSIRNSLVSFCDNSSVISGYDTTYFQMSKDKEYFFLKKKVNPVLTAETHNFPTLISPFQGATTGVGGRIRDVQATGIGATPIASLAGYCVGDIFNTADSYGNYKHPIDILIEASNGASDYGNKFGEAIIGGFTRSFSYEKDNQRIEWVKPIMFSAGIGSILQENTFKKDISTDMLIIRIGGPAYKIGMGGGYSSSISQTSDNCDKDYSAVQRGDAEMETKMNNVLRYLIDNNNPIISIHDQGSGGLGNVVKEIVSPYGGKINLENVTLGDKSMTPLEIWCSEFQESNVLVIKCNDLDRLTSLCKRENICCDILGTITDDNYIKVFYKNTLLVDLPLKPILEPPLQKTYKMQKVNYNLIQASEIISNYSLEYNLHKVLSHPDVCSKRYLVNKVDRSVSGLIVQQQCVGPFHTPINNYQLVSTGFINHKGIATSIGEKPILSLFNHHACGSMAVGEMVTNMMGVYIGGKTDYIKCSSNWMWDLKKEGENSNLYDTCQSMCDIMQILGIGIDGGKDSLSMSVDINNKKVSAPGNLVVTGYVSCPNITYRVTPEFKNYNSKLVYVKFSDKSRLGGSIYQRINNNLNGEAPTLNRIYTSRLKDAFAVIQQHIFKNIIYSLHDVSDGGLITTLSEMCIASNIGANIEIYSENIIEDMFSEELGVVIEVDNSSALILDLERYNVEARVIGTTTVQKKLIINDVLNIPITLLRESWEMTSNMLEKKQMNISKANQQESIKYYAHLEPYYLSKYIHYECNYEFKHNILRDGPKVAIIREEGSNGFKEMAAAFSMASFSTFDVHMNDLLNCPEMLKNFNGIAFVGGFSLSDTFGAATGWRSTMKYNKILKNEIKAFYKRNDTFSLGVCNGCQLMIKMNLLDTKVKITDNDSDRFESRFTTIKVNETNSIFFKNMANVEFGMWVAHKTGKIINTDKLSDEQIPLVYSFESNPTQFYPFNPNGSERGIAAISSENGRHLALMPHPERSFLTWQLPYLGNYNEIKKSPWFLIFLNAYAWVKKE